MLAAVTAAYNDPEIQTLWPEHDPLLPGLLQELQASQYPREDVTHPLHMRYQDRGKSQLSGMTPSAAADW